MAKSKTERWDRPRMLRPNSSTHMTLPGGRRREHIATVHEVSEAVAETPIPPHIDKTKLVNLLRRVGAKKKRYLVAVKIQHDDPTFDWKSLTHQSVASMPSIYEGQRRDRRYRTEGEEGLHEHVFSTYSEFHLDSFHPVDHPLKHLHKDTDFVTKVGGGALICLSSAVLFGLPLIGAGVVGIAAGTARTKSRKKRVYTLRGLPLAAC